jgi:GST-like protein
MIDLYFWTTPNGYKATIMLAEVGLGYQLVPVDITAGDQFKPEFLKISPNNKIPAMVDHAGPNGEPYSVFESGAMLMYLAEKTGCLLPQALRSRMMVIQWLMFQMGSMGPMLGQAHHFRKYAPDKIPYAIDRYTREASRLYGVIDRRLADNEFLAGEYSIADIATFTWVRPHRWQGQNLEDYPNLKRWYETIKARPAVQSGLAVMQESKKWEAKPGTASWNNMFNPKSQ